MKKDDIIMFRKSRLSDKLTEGKLGERCFTMNLKGEQPWWTVEFGKKVKKKMTIHDSQIEGLV